MDLTPVNIHIKQIGQPGILTFGLGKIFHKIFSTEEVKSKYYYPIFYRLPGTPIPPITISVIEDIKNNNCLILVVHPMEGFAWDSYDEFIEEICSLYSLSYENFVALNCNPVPSSKYKSIFYNFWEFSSFSENIIKEQNLGREHIFKDIHRPYKFISLNRISHPHRFATVTALYPYKDCGLLSFANKEYPPPCEQREANLYWFKEQYSTYYDKFKNLNLPENFSLDLPEPLEDPDNKHLPNAVIIDSYTDKFYHSYLHIVCETFVSHVFFSEKTYKPIKYLQPFILINGQYSLQYLRDLGYKTFSGYIDESYDLESNNERRIELAIQASLDFINREDLHEVMKEMYPIFKHNHNVFIERCKNFQDNLHSDISKILNAQDNNAN